MCNRVWKSLNNYCLLELNTTGVSHKDRILEIVILKVVDDEIVDKFETKINPNFRLLEKQVEYQKYFSYPTVENIVPELLDFIKGFYLVGWCIDFDMKHLESEGKFEYKKNVVDVFESYYRTHKNSVIPCSLENVYNYEYSHSSKKKNYNFDDLYERCLALKQLYESKMHYNKYIHSKLPRADYIEFPDGSKLWLKGKKQGKFEK